MSLDRLLPKTIGARMVVALGVASAVVLGSIALTAFQVGRSSLIAQADADAFTKVRTAANAVDEAVNRLAYIPRMLAAYQAGAGHEPRPELEFFLRNLLRRIPAREIHGAYIAFDDREWSAPRGMVWMDRLSWPALRRIDYDFHDPGVEWYAGAKRTGSLYVSEPFFEADGSNIAMVAVSFPVFIDRIFVGVAGVDLPISEIGNLVRSAHDREPVRRLMGAGQGFVALATREGRLLAHPDPALLPDGESSGGTLASLALGQQLMAEQEGSARYEGADGERIVHWTVAPLTGWKVVLDQPASIVTVPIAELARRTALMGGGGLLIFLILVGLISRRATRPIVKLERAAKGLEKGDYDVAELDPLARRVDESGRLARAFQSMAKEIRAREARLADWNQNLEATIEARTADLVMAREAAEEANRTKSAFLANMSHELRTPMNAIIGYSEMLMEEAADLGQEDFVPDLKKIHTAGKHLLGLINDVLDLSKIEAGKMTLYLEEFSVSTMIEEVAATIRPLVGKNRNRLELECASDVGRMHADITKVRQTLFNLLSNAAKFTHEGRIRLRVTERGWNGHECIAFEVTDTGIGMTPDQMGKLFNAFAQADASTTRKYGGTGLGLAISRRFCLMMGGDITVESEHGKGTTFTAYVPRVVEDSAATVAPDPAAAAPQIPGAVSPATGSGPLILVVDDDPAVLDLLSRNLAREGYSVRTASSGAAALSLARELRPALITLDVMMPSMDGWSVLTALKTDPVTHAIPVVMISIVDDRQLGFTLGAADYLTKPIDRERLSLVLGRYAPVARNRTALVIDDLVENREMLRHALEREGWNVVEAANGQEGIDRFAQEGPGLILLDLMMPVLDGFGFLRALRVRPDGADVPVVVVTAKELTPEDREFLRTSVENVIQNEGIAHEPLMKEIRQKIGEAVNG